MSYWVREIAGWLLVLLGLGMFFVVYDWCSPPKRLIFGGGIMAVVGIFVFRGGIHLLKVAIAARVCMQTQEQVYLRKSSEPVVSPRRGGTSR
jgi:vacuolar-type H+-ATPase subunit I/STV1